MECTYIPSYPPAPFPPTLLPLFCRLTPLSAAVLSGQTEVVRLLLEQGADMDLLPGDEDGAPQSSLIEIAASSGHLDTMNLLIQAKMFKDQAQEQQQKQQLQEQHPGDRRDSGGQRQHPSLKL